MPRSHHQPTPDPQGSRQLLTPRDVAQEYSVEPQTVYNWIENGVIVCGHPVRLSAFKVGKHWRISRESLDQFLYACNPENWRAAALEQERQRKAMEEMGRQAR